MSRYILSVDEYNHWSVFDTATALGKFDTWAEADEFRKSLEPSETKGESGSAWTPKSGGY